MSQQSDHAKAITTKTMALSNTYGETGSLMLNQTLTNVLNSPNYSKTLVVYVGQFEQVFIVHEDKLIVKSKFFRAACSSKWKKGASDIVRLPEVELDTFQMYTDWVYSDTIVPPEPSIRALIELYLLGEFLNDVKLRNATMRLLVASVHTYKTFPKVGSIKSIWNNTAPNSLLRSWIVDVAAKYYDKAAFAEHALTFPAEFVLQVALNSCQYSILALPVHFCGKSRNIWKWRRSIERTVPTCSRTVEGGT
jgi:hypothetical protein